MDKIITLMLLTFFSCSTVYQTSSVNVEYENREKDVFTKNKFISTVLILQKDTIFYCNGNKDYGSVRFDHQTKKMDIKFDFMGKRNCFCNKAYKGNERAINILLLSHINTASLYCSRYRGKEFFDIVKDRVNIFDVIDAPGSPNHNMTIYEDVYRTRLFDMIKTIDGQKPIRYVINYMSDVLNIPSDKISHLTYEYGVEFLKYEYESTVYAWKNGLVVLKDYGEE
ncbi:MAG: hypothetical protein V3V14_00505 [Saprospiraceae bacterium]